MGTCTMMNCLRPISGMALICDEHKAERATACANQRTLSDYSPTNPDCTYSACARESCDHCHYCGEVHHWEPVPA